VQRSVPPVQRSVPPVHHIKVHIGALI